MKWTQWTEFRLWTLIWVINFSWVFSRKNQWNRMNERSDDFEQRHLQNFWIKSRWKQSEKKTRRENHCQPNLTLTPTIIIIIFFNRSIIIIHIFIIIFNVQKKQQDNDWLIYGQTRKKRKPAKIGFSFLLFFSISIAFWIYIKFDDQKVPIIKYNQLFISSKVISSLFMCF